MVRYLVIFAVLASSPTFAKSYGLVLIGPSHANDSGRHDMARLGAGVALGLRDKAYDVTTLFGPGADTKNEEFKTFKADYDFFKETGLIGEKSAGKKLLGRDPDATAKNVDAYFANLLTVVASGDKVQITVAAHGTQSCDKQEDVEAGDDRKSNCEHVFSLFDEKGEAVYYTTAQLAEHVKKLEAKGALVNLVLNSCHSGRAKGAFKDLKNACVYFGSMGNSPSHSCFEQDFSLDPSAIDYTASGEMVSLHTYAHLMGELGKNKYFSDSRCFQELTKHVTKHKAKLNFSTTHDAYWSSRAFNESLEEPSLSTVTRYGYFARDHVAGTLSHSAELDVSQPNALDAKTVSTIATDLDELLAGKAKGAEGKKIQEELLPYREALAKATEGYNASIAAQKKLLGHKGNLNEISDAQGATRTAAREVIRKERAMVQKARELASNAFPEETNACKREL